MGTGTLLQQMLHIQRDGLWRDEGKRWGKHPLPKGAQFGAAPRIGARREPIMTELPITGFQYVESLWR
jgi:hypothetical protein